MTGYPERIQALIESLKQLPGLGRRSAERIALYLLKAKSEEVYGLADLITQTKREVRFCEECGNFSESVRCQICQDTERDKTMICVVEEPRDVARFERSGRYRGVYHVLFGILSPLDGIGPADLRITDLERRVKKTPAKEIIIATPTSTDGETTAAYLAERLAPLGIRLTRLARGLPFGSTLEFADDETLQNALENRRNL